MPNSAATCSEKLRNVWRKEVFKLKKNFAVIKVVLIKVAGKLPDKWSQNDTTKNSNRKTDCTYVLL